MVSNEIETSGGHISSTTAVWEVPLGFLDASGFPLQNNIKIGKVPKIAGNRVFLVGLPLYFPKLQLDAAITRVPRGVGSSKVWFWMPLGSLPIKAFSLKK